VGMRREKMLVYFQFKPPIVFRKPSSEKSCQSIRYTPLGCIAADFQLEELLVANTIQIDAMYQLLIQKGFFTEAEFLDKLKQVQVDYQSKQPTQD
jgi:hypothetical protein